MACHVDYQLLRRREAVAERLAYAARLVAASRGQATGLYEAARARFGGHALGDRLVDDVRFAVEELHQAEDSLAAALASTAKIDVTVEDDDDEE
ncbi:hypothetical protein [Collinsella intestinalis]|uniref:hypothetical protein n=1 Tax=Collinsella intestinalis TaxID=147207 RepID=UPI00195C42A3|nr:hypothetical protein [Collinsella intestinalis]MBM6941555.1 hypothetical protein [Collinsella intestinalis]